MANAISAEDKLQQIRMVLDRIGERIAALRHCNYPMASILTAMSEGLDEIEAVVRLQKARSS